MTDKALNLLQFAAKAGRLSYGTHATEWAITSGKAKLVLAANDISAKSIKELNFKASKTGISVKILSATDSECLSQAIGKRCGIVAVNDESFANAILEKLN
ncbi:MAG: ribosomal L7Ae/L30e/S12e/Gadd45 family protein [Clostridia bacterium]|nr:ribosomal L7Ae/L30e/S12e/Gadd45 family protein [Clostridia bacterium]